MLFCKCSLPDGTSIDITIGKNATGADLLGSVCSYLNIQNSSVVGLVFKDGRFDPSCNWWVRPEKVLRKQMRGKCNVWAFALVVKFYPKSKFNEMEDLIRRYTVLQVHDDLLTGRISCPPNTLSILCGYWAQSELGDFRCDEVDRNLLEDFRIMGKQESDSEFEFVEKAINIHKQIKGMPGTKAETHFLKLASSLSLYGCHFYSAYETKATKGGQFRSQAVVIGVSEDGFRVGTSKLYQWSFIYSVLYKNNSIAVKLTQSSNHESRLQFVFDCSAQSKIVWRAAVDAHMHSKKRDEMNFEIARKLIYFGKKQVKFVSPGAANFPSITKKHSSLPPSVRGSKLSLFKSKSPVPNPKAIHFTSPSPKSVHSQNEKAKNVSTSHEDPQLRTSDQGSPAIARKVGSAVPRRLKKRKMSFDGEGHLSDASDNTEVLCSKNIIEKTFSYAEKDGVNAINDWLQLCSPREGKEKTTCVVSRSAPASHRSPSPGRALPPPDDIDDYKPLIRSKCPITIRAQHRKEANFPQSAHHAELPNWEDRQSEPDRERNKSYYSDVYKHEYLKNMESRSSRGRRVRSMYSLLPTYYERPISRKVSEAKPNPSPDLSRPLSFRCGIQNRGELPFESDFARRYISDTRLQQDRTLHPDDRTEIKVPSSPSLQFRVPASAKHHETIPTLPSFVRSVV